MHPDALRWDRRYARKTGPADFAVDGVLASLAPLLPRTGTALELACGTAGTALWLAGRGLTVTALDVSRVALRLQRDEAARRGVDLHTVVADALALPLGPVCFDLVVVTRYLERSLFAVLRERVAPGGCVFFRTFNTRHLLQRPGFNPDFVLRDGELREAFSGFTVLAGNDGSGDGAGSSHILARRPD
jgi:2-polyprenyl-3-methyl-5-hydroxy-6-metoxy-1,4-benzoquinol methylase